MLRSRFAATALCAFSIFGALLAPVVASAQTSGNGGTTMTEHQTMSSEPGMPASGHPAQTSGGDTMQKPGDTMTKQGDTMNHQPMNLPMTGSGDEMPWGLALAAAGALMLVGLALRRGRFATRRG